MTGGGDDSHSPYQGLHLDEHDRCVRRPRPSPPPTAPARPRPPPSPSPRTSPPRPARPSTLTGGPWYTTALRPADARLGHGRRLRPRHHHAGRRARLRPALGRHLRHLQRLLDAGHPRRRRRHHRHQRQLLPLPHPHLRQRRQHQRQLHRNRRRQGRHHRAGRAGADRSDRGHRRRQPALRRADQHALVPAHRLRIVHRSNAHRHRRRVRDRSASASPTCPACPASQAAPHRHDQPVHLDDLHLDLGDRNARHTNASPPPTAPASPHRRTITISPDTTAPTGQTVDLAGGPWYTTASVPLTLGNGTDGQSGLDTTSGVVQRASATLIDGDLRDLRLLVDGHPRRRRRHHRPAAATATATVPDLRQRRQPERQLHRQHGREGRHHRAERAVARLLRP